jgi:hypothetical protein
MASKSNANEFLPHDDIVCLNQLAETVDIARHIQMLACDTAEPLGEFLC